MKNKTIFISGGTGSFGKEFTNFVIKNLNPKKIIIFSRDELKQFEMKKSFNKNQLKKIRFFIGDIRDYSRLEYALAGVDIAVHAAALKQIGACEYNPFEAIKTNIIGSNNLIQACIHNKVGKILALSTDKASSPINLYGATKLTSDKLFVSANYHRGPSGMKFSVVRYGNVFSSRGSVVTVFKKLKSQNKPFEITHPNMTRFNITLNQGVKFVIDSINEMQGGEIFVPKLPSFKIIDLAKAINPKAKIKVTGISYGEKLHEEMISSNETGEILSYKKKYIILPDMKMLSWKKEHYLKRKPYPKILKHFSYQSDTNKNFLNISDLKSLLKKNLE